MGGGGGGAQSTLCASTATNPNAIAQASVVQSMSRLRARRRLSSWGICEGE